ncbi:MAG TPA: hypothetical protein ENH34_05315 [Phycisphaerales bacterium]|nr:hypothetical protein [Phycisphaerales bacterium]
MSKGHWGEGNHGNGLGNICTGNQGCGVGGGMAGGSRPGQPNPESDIQSELTSEIQSEPAPLPQTVVPGFEEVAFVEGGCPALMVWLAEEIGVPEEDIQIYVANIFALSSDIQPCEICARLKDSATILEDADGTKMAALAQVVNEFVQPSAPPSEEQMALIGQALARYRDISDGTHYAAAGQWLDALVEYVGILTTEIGLPEDEAVTLVANKYVVPAIEDGDASLIMFVQVRLAALMLSRSNISRHKSPEPRNPQPFRKEASVRRAVAGASIVRTSTKPIYIFGGLGILGAVGAILATLVKLKVG